MRSWLIIVGMRRPKSGKSMRVINYALKIVYLRCIFGLNTSIKLNEMRIDAIVVFFRSHRPFKASFYEVGWRPLRDRKRRKGDPVTNQILFSI